MQWSNSKFHSSFSQKLPLYLCSLILTFASNDLTASGQEMLSKIEVKNEEEAFLIRRIAEFWKDRDYQLVKTQIQNFLQKFPSSPINDQLRGVLGDLYLQDKQHQEALATYSKIKSQSVAEKTLVNRLQCYYELNDYASLLKEGKPYLSTREKRIDNRKEELHFLLAESLFRLAMESGDKNLREEYALQAEPLYAGLSSTTFEKHAKLALAEIHHVLQQHESAAQAFIELAQLYPDQKEDFLNQAALAQSEFDPLTAIETFTEVMNLKGERASDAALNRFILFFQEEQFTEVLSSYDTIKSSIQIEKKPTVDYIMGRSYFATQNHEKASEFLTQYILSQSTPSLQLKNALLMQLNTAQALEDNDLGDLCLNRLKELFSQEPEYSEALYIHALMAKKRGDFGLAEEELATVLKTNRFKDQESLLLEYGLVTHESGKWKESYQTFKTLQELYPKSEHTNLTLKYFLSSSLNLYKEGEGKESSYNQEKFYSDLLFVLQEQENQGNLLTLEEEKECRLLAAKTSFELGHYLIAIEQLESFIETYPTEKTLGEVYLLYGICHQQAGSDPELFYSSIEKALAYNPELESQSSLHLQLYNAYLNKVEYRKSKQEKQPSTLSENDLYTLAADHLYKALSLGDRQIKPENRLWLADHFYQKVKNDPQNLNAHLVKSIELYRDLLIDPSTKELILFSQEHLHLESEVLKLAELYSTLNSPQEKVLLLKKLVEQQTRQHTMKWKYQIQSMLELAQTYETLQEDENALDTYVFITKNCKNAPSYIHDFATLHANRIQFNLMDRNLKHDKNEQILTMLNQLKDIQIKKSPSSEPLHLEAALAYAKIRAEISPQESREEKYLFYLNRIMEDYLSSQDQLILDYQKKLARSPEKQAVYKAYIAYFEAEIFRTKALLELKENCLTQAEELNSLALNKLSDLQFNDKLTTYLSDNIKNSIQQISVSH